MGDFICAVLFCGYIVSESVSTLQSDVQASGAHRPSLWFNFFSTVAARVRYRRAISVVLRAVGSDELLL